MKETAGTIRMKICELERSEVLSAKVYAELGRLYFQLSKCQEVLSNPEMCGALRKEGFGFYKLAIEKDPAHEIDFSGLPNAYRCALMAYQNLKSGDEARMKTEILPLVSA